MKILKVILPLLLLSGCSAYSWKSSVPQDMRSVAVPVFRNESDVTGLGGAVARQILREVQRDGTFRVASSDDCAIEIQGVIESVVRGGMYSRREKYLRTRDRALDMKAKISFVDRRNGRILVDNREYVASATYISDEDGVTAQRDASGRVAEDLARQVIDDLVNFDFGKTEVENGK